METTIFYGNGVNLLGGNGVSWGNLLESISHGKKPLQITSYTLKYESIVLPLDEKTHPVLRDKLGRRLITSDGFVLCSTEDTEIFAIKNKICNILDEHEPSYYYDKLVSLKADNYLTTNYELFLIYALLNQGYIIHQSVMDKSLLYKHVVLQKDNKNVTVWNIHGDIVNPKSIIIGYADYSSYTTNVHRILEKKRKIKNSWVNYFFNTNVHIIGYGLADDEMEIWDILVYRARMIRHTGKQKNNIYYYLINKGKGIQSKKKLLEVLKVIVYVIPYENSYEKTYDNIYNLVYDTMNLHNR